MHRIVALLMGTALACSVVPAVASAAAVPFWGTWSSLDTADGSLQYLSIEKSATPKVTLVDASASYCATHAARSTVFTGSGTGMFTSSTVLRVSMASAGCASFKVPLSIFAGLTYRYSSTLKTLRDSFGNTWFRYPPGATIPRHVAGNFVGSAGSPVVTAMFLFQVDTSAAGALQAGYYTFNAMTGAADGAGARSQATVDTVRFFTAASGAPAAEFTGWECLLAKTPAGPDPVGTCGHYRIIVTDGSSIGGTDTFCGGKADVTDPSDPLYCPYVWSVDKGDIRIFGAG
jgi:hypothetical protein